MITLFRWYRMKAKEIQVKLALYRCLEKAVHYMAENTDDLKKMFVHELAGILHNASAEKE